MYCPQVSLHSTSPQGKQALDSLSPMQMHAVLNLQSLHENYENQSSFSGPNDPIQLRKVFSADCYYWSQIDYFQGSQASTGPSER